ncbi:MAG TPA: bifunctional [glutamine synthetase] adenylyltransferase/[glutamine synthetase]-adenylyl-L-tyrosine phosphorylase [Actinomycetota bacterium]|nr:bifunctional [glutamine synthetase] adenylyltransferase/[glutamine synthetase]-adenylyl-L-tyrosine phosphorylase [Actinomycetota bacterium]
MEGDPATRRIDALRVGSRSLTELVARDDAARALVERTGALPRRDELRAVALDALARGGLRELRLEKRRRVLEIAARDLAGEVPVEDATAALADVADAWLDAALAAVDAPDGLAVIAMGKLGGRELNYASDIDVVFVARGDVRRATVAAEALLAALGSFAPEGRAFSIDVDLRPEGRNGALVRSPEAYLEHYRRWADAWEFQALVKARAAAGDVEVAAAAVDGTRPLVFARDVAPERIAAIRAMKERVEDQASSRARRARSSESDDVKLGPGGIRDIEFSVQLLQLVHGGADDSVRSPNTLDALSRLVEGGYVAEDDGAGLAVAYRWLRSVEHRLQLYAERRVHRLPAERDARTRIARAMGFRDTPAASALTRFEGRHRGVLADVRGRFEKLFYRPMIESLADAAPHRLSHEGLIERLRILGFRDVERAARVLAGLVTGTSRRAKLFRVLTPALLRRLAHTPSPDAGLLAFLRLGESLGGRVDALGALRDNPPGIAFLAVVLGSGRHLGELLAQAPDELNVIAAPRGPSAPRSREALVHEARAQLRWREPERRLDGLRRFKRRAALRIALADLAGALDESGVGAALADLADACLEAALHEASVPVAVVGMGKLGGRELSYASDVDVVFVHDGDRDEAQRAAEAVLAGVGALTPEGQAFQVDVALRPEGKSGPLVRSLDSYLEYYERWARPWELQSLLKARAAAGDHSLGRRFVEATRSYAYPERLRPEALAEIRHLKARMERERVPRGVDPRRHLKMGPGGMADVEFSTQIVQLAHAHSHPELHAGDTLGALRAAAALGLVRDDDARRLADAYRWLMRARNRMFLLFARPRDVLPVVPEELEALGIAMGYSEQPRQEVEEDYLRLTRRARAVAERIVYG